MDPETLESWVAGAADRHAEIEAIRAALAKLSGSIHPVDHVQWVPIEKIQANDYNPNAVAQVEMKLLLRSIQHDGYTQPIVTVYDPEKDLYVIVDGFHRYSVCRASKEVRDSTGGLLPIVVLRKSLAERMAATVRHNRARGRHSTAGMSSMIFKMLEEGLSDEQICNELGMEPEELLRLKHITGFSKLFENAQYSQAWESKSQIRQRLLYQKKKKADGEKG